MIFIGIDPGLDGAVAVIDAGKPSMVWDTPTLTVKGENGNRREYALRRMAECLTQYRSAVAYIENVHAMPGQGVRSMFTMGYGVGAWEGILAALGIVYTRVTPQRWKASMLDGMGKDKDAGRMRAMQLFPAYASLFERKKDDGRADAILIAEYGRRING